MFKEEMTSRERVMAALEHKPTDRIPIDIGGMHNLTTMHKDLYASLQKHWGIDEPVVISSGASQTIQPNRFLRERFHTDCYPLYFPLSEQQKHPRTNADGSQEYTDEWGLICRRPAGGLYFEPVTHPMIDFEIEDLEQFPFPGPYPDQVYADLAQHAKEVHEKTDYALVMNGPIDGNTMLQAAYLLSHEEFYARLITDKEFIRALMEKLVEYHCRHWTKIFEFMGDYIDIVRYGDDLGSQEAPLIAPEIYRDLIKPAHKKIHEHVLSLKSTVKSVNHCDGAIRDFIPDFIDIGYTAWNPVQVSARGIDDTAWLKKTYGDKICFWGAGCDSQQVIARKTPEEIRAEVWRRVNDLAENGGLILGSIHNLQKNVPVENMIVFYDALYQYSIEYYHTR